ARILPTRGMERVAGLAVVCKRVPEHHGVARREAMVDSGGSLGPGARCGERIVVHTAGSQDAIDRGHHGGRDERILQGAAVLLLETQVIESAILDQRTAQGQAGAIAVKIGRLSLRLEGIAGVQGTVFYEDESVAVKGMVAD